MLLHKFGVLCSSMEFFLIFSQGKKLKFDIADKGEGKWILAYVVT